MFITDKDTLDLSPHDTCRRIANLTKFMMEFWCDGGWAPPEAAQLLRKSTLKLQASLADCLERWVDSESDGELVLAWTHLGALVEGQMKLFLSVYLHDYVNDPNAIKAKNAILHPDGFTLNILREFFVKSIWQNKLPSITPQDWNPYVSLIQSRRNTIHAYQYKDIGSFDEWRNMLPVHLTFVRHICDQLPYPDECNFSCEAWELNRIP